MITCSKCFSEHDLWCDRPGDEPLFGKQWVCDEFGRATTWESFDRGGWHVVLLDSVFPWRESYIGRLDDAQWDWFESDLAAVPATTPVLVVSHIPILSVHAVELAKPLGDGDARPYLPVRGDYVHVDHARFRKVFAKHPNVKACLSGHLHVVEDIQYGGMRYLCNGAVAAGWWRGFHYGTDYGYALVDLFDDGSVECRYMPYGWKTQA